MPNPRSAPVGGKPSIRQSNASHPTTRHHVSGANSQVSSGLVTHQEELFTSLKGLIFNTFVLIPRRGKSNMLVRISNIVECKNCK